MFPVSNALFQILEHVQHVVSLIFTCAFFLHSQHLAMEKDYLGGANGFETASLALKHPERGAKSCHRCRKEGSAKACLEGPVWTRPWPPTSHRIRKSWRKSWLPCRPLGSVVSSTQSLANEFGKFQAKSTVAIEESESIEVYSFKDQGTQSHIAGCSRDQRLGF